MTLVELTIVVLIIGILTAVAVPRFVSSLDHHRLESCLAMLRADIEAARQRAIAASATQTITFDSTSDTCNVAATFQRDGFAGPRDMVLLNAAPWYCVIETLAVGDDRTELPTVQVTFNGAGVASPDLRIHLRSGSRSRILHLDSSSGSTGVE